MKNTCLGIICIIMWMPLMATSQTSDTSGYNLDISQKLSSKYIRDMSNRSAEYQEKMEAGTEKYLDKLKSQEQILQQQLNKINPEKANRIFGNSAQVYDKLQTDVRNNADNIIKGYGKYVPGIDSAITSLKFLQQNGLSGKLGTGTAQISTAMSKIKALEDQFRKTDNVEDFIKQREVFLQQQLSGYSFPGLRQYNQQAAYYAQEMNELKADWDDPSRMEQKTMTMLNKLPAFQEFMRKNSAIAGLFNLPDDYSTSGVAGLQTKDQVQKAMAESMKMMGPNGTQAAQQNIGDAQSTLNSLRNKLNSGSSELAMPAGQGNDQHTRSFLKRIEYGVNIQSSMASSYFPSQTAFALTAGYKLNERNTIGIGVSYNVGWGKDIQHISISSQGMGFRSFADFKIKGSIYGSGGFEYNYTQPFVSINQLEISGLWQKSGLIGITKMVSLSGKLVKKTKLQLLWNFLSYYQIPKTQPIIFRLGYNF